jgi:sec-independent protein translocase protein TatC
MFEHIRPHIQELRERLIKSIITLIVTFFICFAFWEPLLAWIIVPLKNALSSNSQVIAYKMGEQFFVAVIVSFFAALFISLPVIFYQLWSFIAPGLYENEKKYVIPFVLSATVMFFLGASFAYFIVFPYGFTYLVNFGGDTVNAMISIGEYLGFFLKLIFGFGVSFELPVFAFFLAALGLITDRSLIDFFKYAILIIFVFAAILTPPDILTQFLMALPLIALYGLSIVIVKMVNPEKPDEEENEE